MGQLPLSSHLSPPQRPPQGSRKPPGKCRECSEAELSRHPPTLQVISQQSSREKSEVPTPDSKSALPRIEEAPHEPLAYRTAAPPMIILSGVLHPPPASLQPWMERPASLGRPMLERIRPQQPTNSGAGREDAGLAR